MDKKNKAESQELNTSYTLSCSDVSLDYVPDKLLTTEFSRWVRVLLQNWRQGTVAVKGRADISFSNKKPWKQKGTGRARAGSARSPLWRGGGVTFGPQERSKKLTVSKKVKRNVVLALLKDRLDAGRVVVLDWNPGNDRPKTARAFAALAGANLAQKSVTLFLPIDDMYSFASFSNIPSVRILFFDQLNAFDLAYTEHWIVLKKDVDIFKNMVAQWL